MPMVDPVPRADPMPMVAPIPMVDSQPIMPPPLCIYVDSHHHLFTSLQVSKIIYFLRCDTDENASAANIKFYVGNTWFDWATWSRTAPLPTGAGGPGTLCGENVIPPVWPVTQFSVVCSPSPVSGRYITIQREGGFLSAREIVVIG